MRSISDTITRLTALRAPMGPLQDRTSVDRLSDLPAFGANPGALQARIYVPEALADNASLVVVLHGCTQTAAAYDLGSGWSRLADELGFALLFPQQQRSNNPNLCFNWFEPGDARRGAGEVHSIRQMIEAVVTGHGLDRRRVFITGLSAGGAMAAAMLASYPEVFAGGAIIAGLPFGAANTVPEAFDRMRGQGLPTERELKRSMRIASGHEGPWPTLSLWHGGADQTVHPANADAILGQWRSLQGLDAAPTCTEKIGGTTRRVWCSKDGREVIEAFSIPGMGHGTPLDTSGADGLGFQGAYMLDVGISSTRRIARFWGLADPADTGQATPKGQPADIAAAVADLEEAEASKSAVAGNAPAHPREAGVLSRESTGGVGKTIEEALRKAGLMP